MSRAVFFTQAARKDIRKAFQWYEARSAGLGPEFVGEVGLASARLADNPLVFRLERVKYRRIRLHRFPYALHFRIENDGTVTVLACLHFRQSPDRWPGA